MPELMLVIWLFRDRTAIAATIKKALLLITTVPTQVLRRLTVVMTIALIKPISSFSTDNSWQRQY